MEIMGEGKRRSGRESLDGARGNPGARGSLAPPVYPCDVGIRRGKYGRTRRRRTVGNHVECAGGADESRRLDGDLCSALPPRSVLSRIFRLVCTLGSETVLQGYGQGPGRRHNCARTRITRISTEQRAGA